MTDPDRVRCWEPRTLDAALRRLTEQPPATRRGWPTHRHKARTRARRALRRNPTE
ncbi:hypothetical protein J8M97_20530 [Gordonia polyisoprenivorans]|uniref:hypothetical protein n=1 Tax=Gordonia polyisoprenivorans TaxID=84595 RepID=UPI001B8B8068|nr:hypothetical protein [Gordonia polyisoprenivorans]QUD82096.1 hypothetical protein J8M97_20530 [Gordonia polyisoprenivorans]